jgi:hypothetical protein
MKNSGRCSPSLSALVVALVLVGPTEAGECPDLSFQSVGSEPLPLDWKVLTFPKIVRHTSYTLVRDGRNVWIKAESRNSASALVREIRADPKIYPILR